MQHVLHVPTVRRDFEQLYERLKDGERIEPNDTVLLLSILASIASYWSTSDSQPSIRLFDSIHTACKAANHWLKTTLDVLEHVKRTASATLATVQAGMILIFLIYHMEGFSPKVRAILAAALSSARDLALHQTDRHRNTQSDESSVEIVYKEMGRRVWWHLACTDWSVCQRT